MRLKSVVAPDPVRALAKVRSLLGDEAVIVATQDLKEGGVRVTVAIDHEDLDLADLLAPGAAPEAAPWLLELAEHHGISTALLARLEQAMAGTVEADPALALGRALQRVFRFAPLPSASPEPLLLLGPPGAGKTASAAKLAARAVLGAGSVEVISADVERAGGAEQLQALLRPLGLDARPAADLATLRRTVREVRADLVLVDTPGLNPFRPADLGRVSGLIEAGGGEPLLVLPAGLAPADCADIAHTYLALGATRLLATKVDAARRLGGLLAAAEAGLAFSDAGIGPTIGRGLSPLGAPGLARLLVHARKVRAQPEPRPPARRAADE